MRTRLEEWVRHDVLPDGARVLVRPLRPEDEALYPDFLSEVTPEDLRLRFFMAVRQLSPAVIEKLTHLDYDRAMAFIAIEEATGKMLGVVRLHLDDDRRGGEYAVLVRSRLKGHGLGWLLMQRMIAYAKAEGLERVHGQVLPENKTMLGMCAHLGFHIAEDPDGGGVKVVTLPLSDRRVPAPAAG